MKKLFKYFFITITICLALLIHSNVYAANAGDTYKCTYYINVSQNGSIKRVNLLNVYWKFTSFNKYETYTPESGNSYESLENEFYKVTTAKYISMASNSLCPTYCVIETSKGTLNFQTKDENISVNCLPDGIISSEKTVIKLATNNSTNNSNNNTTNNSNNNSNNTTNNTNNAQTPNKGKNTKNIFLGNTTCGGLDYFTFPNGLPVLTSFLYTLIKIAVPVILIIKGSLDMFKAVSSQKEDEMKKAQKKFTQRLIAGGIALLSFIIIETVINFIAVKTNNSNAWDCVNCFIKNKCETVNS